MEMISRSDLKELIVGRWFSDIGALPWDTRAKEQAYFDLIKTFRDAGFTFDEIKECKRYVFKFSNGETRKNKTASAGKNEILELAWMRALGSAFADFIPSVGSHFKTENKEAIARYAEIKDPKSNYFPEEEVLDIEVLMKRAEEEARVLAEFKKNNIKPGTEAQVLEINEEERRLRLEGSDE